MIRHLCSWGSPLFPDIVFRYESFPSDTFNVPVNVPQRTILSPEVGGEFGSEERGCGIGAYNISMWPAHLQGRMASVNAKVQALEKRSLRKAESQKTQALER